MDSTRVDRWLWAVRVLPTRSAATEACRAGHVRVNGRLAKPATPVRVGDRTEVVLGGRTRIVEVVQAIDRRVGASVAATCLVDHSPPRPDRETTTLGVMRSPGAGRPTKRDRRRLDQLRDR